MKTFNKVSNWLNKILDPYEMSDEDLTIPEKCEILSLDVEFLKEKILKLEDENISLTNELYKLQNSLDARIDIFAEKLGISNV